MEKLSRPLAVSGSERNLEARLSRLMYLYRRRDTKPAKYRITFQLWTREDLPGTASGNGGTPIIIAFSLFAGATLQTMVNKYSSATRGRRTNLVVLGEGFAGTFVPRFTSSEVNCFLKSFLSRVAKDSFRFLLFVDRKEPL